MKGTIRVHVCSHLISHSTIVSSTLSNTINNLYQSLVFRNTRSILFVTDFASTFAHKIIMSIQIFIFWFYQEHI